MSYCWAIAGVLSKPYLVSETRFLGNLVRGNGVSHKLWAPRLLGEKKPFLGRYQIARAQSVGGSPMVAVYDGDKYIACVRQDTVLVDPTYHGRGIGSEAIAEFYPTWPIVMLLREQNQEPHTFILTEPAEKALRKAYKLLLQRGAVIANS